MHSLLNKLPKEMLIEIIEKQNVYDYYDEKECSSQIEKIRKREKMLKEERWKKILENIDHLIPTSVIGQTWDRKVFNLNKIYITNYDDHVKLNIDYLDVEKEIGVIFIFDKGKRKCSIGLTDSDYPDIWICELINLKNLNPDFEHLYKYIIKKEFINLIFG